MRYEKRTIPYGGLCNHSWPISDGYGETRDMKLQGQPNVPVAKYVISNIPFEELMKHIIDYKTTGMYPYRGMTKDKKNEFRRKAKTFKLLDNGDLMYPATG